MTTKELEQQEDLQLQEELITLVQKIQSGDEITTSNAIDLLTKNVLKIIL